MLLNILTAAVFAGAGWFLGYRLGVVSAALELLQPGQSIRRLGIYVGIGKDGGS